MDRDLNAQCLQCLEALGKGRRREDIGRFIDKVTGEENTFQHRM